MESEKSEVRCNGENDEREEDDEKMEQFFALIRNFREARDRRKDELRQWEKQHNKARRLNNTTDEQSNWIPCFEWADFTEEIEFRRTPVILPTNNKDDSREQQQQLRDDDGLDLKLTL